MHPLHTLITTAEFFGRNFAFNLDFIPDGKLDWKPSSTANNALEITLQAAGHLLNMKAALTGGQFGEVQIALPASRDEAKDLILRASSDYAGWLPTLDISNFGEPVQLSFGTLCRAQCVAMPVLDLVHHHGQICYIQSILGDREDHFHAMSME